MVSVALLLMIFMGLLITTMEKIFTPEEPLDKILEEYKVTDEPK